MKKVNELMRGWGVTAILLLATSFAFSQSIWTNPITGTNPNTANPYTTGDVVAANLTVSGIGRGAGAVGTNANDRYNANSWATASLDPTAYFEFTLTSNSGCEIDFTSFVYTAQVSSGSASHALRSSLDGFTANIGTTTTTGTTISLAGAAYQNITSAITFRYYVWGTAAATTTYSINSFTFNGAVTCGGCSGPVAQPTTETTADSATPGCTSATITWTASTTADKVIVVISTGAIGSVPVDGNAYTASTVYGSGETIGAGQYVIYNGTGTSVTVTGLTPGTTYNYMIFGYDGVIPDCEENYLTGGNPGSFVTPTSCGTAQITSLLVNSCSGTAEGTDELIVIENGDEAIDIDDMIISLPNTTWCNNGCSGGDGLLVNSPVYLANLNAMAGCSPDLFVYSNPIPAGATIIIFTGDPPSTVLDYSANCGAPGAPIYAIFLDNASITGNFANSGSTIKIIDIDFGNGQTDVVSYIPDNVANTDGGSVNYDANGNPTYYTSTDCVYPLAVQLAYFKAEIVNDEVVLKWGSYAENEADSYLLERSANGIDFEQIGEVDITGNSDFFKSYTYTDREPLKRTISYYRLGMADNYQEVTYSPVIAVEQEIASVSFNQGVVYVDVDLSTLVTGKIRIRSVNGAVVYEGSLFDHTAIPFNHNGLFIVEIPELQYRSKIGCF